VPITNKSSKFKNGTQHYIVKLPKSAGSRHYCPKILQVPGPLAPVLTQALPIGSIDDVDSKIVNAILNANNLWTKIYQTSFS
jgi:hypothetical protein